VPQALLDNRSALLPKVSDAVPSLPVVEGDGASRRKTGPNSLKESYK
jgi:hypothetical protein